MPLCKQCGNYFGFRQMIDGKPKNLKNRTSCFKCSPFVEPTKDKSGAQHLCNTCGKTFVYRRSAGHRLNKCGSCSVSESRKRMTDRALEYKGGKCEICSYSKCPNAMEFHHRDPDGKDFSIKDGRCRKWSAIVIELDKCDLLCCRCHREVHAALYRVTSIPG